MAVKTARPAELKDSVELMVSEDYKDRFKAEFIQTAVRVEKLESMIEKYENGTLQFKPTCPVDLLKLQLRYMKDYLTILEARAKIEKIKI